MIQPVERLEITVLVDNGTDSLSTNPGFVETEIAAHGVDVMMLSHGHWDHAGLCRARYR